MSRDDNDGSNGYEAIAPEYIARRELTMIGVPIVRAWARSLPPGASILDLGCGHGVPVCSALLDDGFEIYGVDASPAMIAAFRARFPGTIVACETVEESDFFGRTFDAAVAVGLMFLLSPEAQRNLLRGIARILDPDGHFLFTSPARRCTWTDVLTGRRSASLGAATYRTELAEAGFTLVGEHVDEGGNHYYAARKETTSSRADPA